MQKALEALGDVFMSMDPYHQKMLERMNKFNERVKKLPWRFPNYILVSNYPKVDIIDLQKTYPNEPYFQFGFVRGYLYVMDHNMRPLLMAEKGYYESLEDAQEAAKYWEERNKEDE